MRNKAQKHVFAAIQRVRERLPFPLLGIDSGNGSQFINDELYRYCQQEHITFTRSRAGRKNDNAHVTALAITASARAPHKGKSVRSARGASRKKKKRRSR